MTTHVVGDEPKQRPRSFAPWRPVDELILTAMAHTRSSVDEMAEHLGRTRREIELHLERLGLA